MSRPLSFPIHFPKNWVSLWNLWVILGVSQTAFGLDLSKGWVDSGTAGESLARLKAAYEAVESSNTIQQVLGPRTENGLTLSTRITGASGVETTKFQHYFKGLEVVGSMAFHHLSENRESISNDVARFSLDATPALTADNAAAIARSFVGGRELTGTPVLKILPQDDDSARLVYWVSLQQAGRMPGHDVIIDAKSGAVIADIEQLYEIAPIEVYSTQNNVGGQIGEECQTTDPGSGAPIEVNPTACDHVVVHNRASQRADLSARSAASNARAVLSYYKLRHRRNSYDDRGSAVVSVVHVGERFDNAFWNPNQKYMGYGSGDAEDFNDFTAALDVAAHEVTHAVTSETAQLIYMGESGALNEAYSDFFGIAVAKDPTWIIGGRIFKDPVKAARGIRNLANPGANTFKLRDGTSGAYPSKGSEKLATSETCGRLNDNCYVHINSTVPGHASYRVAQAIGMAKTEVLYYHVLTQRLAPRANFAKAAEETIAGCKDLFDSYTCERVSAVMTELGM